MSQAAAGRWAPRLASDQGPTISGGEGVEQGVIEGHVGWGGWDGGLVEVQ